MGVAAIVGTLALSYMQGRAQQQAYNAQAQQAQANAQFAENNARKTEEAARIQDQNNKRNEEEARRQNLQRMGQQSAAIGASGITATGSALNELIDSRNAIEREADISSYNNRQGVDSMFDKANDYDNTANMHRAQAASYKKAGSNAFRNAIAGGILQSTMLATSLYSSTSAANQSGAPSGSVSSYVGHNTTATWTSGKGMSFAATNSYKTSYLPSTDFGYAGKQYKVGQGLGWG
ncbi:MAG: hypothetical protein MJZ99_07105 [Bacteroidales bacterium]|nr:hypothetical protein [Bacteroidales bacterium]